MTPPSETGLGTLSQGCLRAWERAGIDAAREVLRGAADAERLNDCGNELARSGAMTVARLAYAEAMRLDLSSAKLRANLGRTLVAEGRVAEGAVWLAAAAERAPSSLPTARSALRALVQAGRHDDAVTLATRLVGAGLDPSLFDLLRVEVPPEHVYVEPASTPSASPRDVDAVERARALGRGGEAARARQAVDDIIAARPLDEAAWLVRTELSIGSDAQAQVLEQLSRALGDGSSLRSPGLLIEAARIADELGRRDQCRAFLDRAAVLFPDAPFVLSALADSAADAGDLPGALSLSERAAELAPGDAALRARLAFHLLSSGDPERSVALLDDSLRLSPFAIELHQARLMTSLYVEAFEHAAAHEHFADLFGEVEQGLLPRSPSPHSRVRVGYLSADFCDHPVARFVFPILEHHDRGRFEVHCYSNTRRSDAYTAKIRALDLVFRDVRGWSDRTIAEQIRRDGIDVLVDLSGHSDGNRLRALAWEPAPVQLSYLGYAHGTGLEQVHYRISDAVADPIPVDPSPRTERIWRLPHVAWTYDAPEHRRPNAWRADGDTIRLVAHHNPAKMSSHALDMWAEVLRRLPEATLNLGSRVTVTRDRYERAFALRGVDPKRLVFPQRLPMAEHYAALRAAHLALDAFPYHGTTTTADALWAGLPVVTRVGSTHVSRVGASLLDAVGLGELVASDDEAYVRCAVELALDPARRARFGGELCERIAHSPLGDGADFTRSFEAALLEASDTVRDDAERHRWRGRRRVHRSGRDVFVLPPSLRDPTTFASLESRPLDRATAALMRRAAPQRALVDVEPIDLRHALAYARHPGAHVHVVEPDGERRRCFEASVAASGLEGRVEVHAHDPRDATDWIARLGLGKRPALVRLRALDGTTLEVLRRDSPTSLLLAPRPADRSAESMAGWCLFDARPGAEAWSEAVGLGDPRAELSLWVPRSLVDSEAGELHLQVGVVDASRACAASQAATFARLSSELHPGGVELAHLPESFRYFVQALGSELEPGARIACLERASLEAKLELLEKPSSLARQLTVARLSLELGRISEAVDLLAPLTERDDLLAQDADPHVSLEPCLPPLAGMPPAPAGHFGRWCAAQSLAVCVLSLPSCLPFAPDVLGLLRRLARTGFEQAELRRRAGLLLALSTALGGGGTEPSRDAASGRDEVSS